MCQFLCKLAINFVCVPAQELCQCNMLVGRTVCSGAGLLTGLILPQTLDTQLQCPLLSGIIACTDSGTSCLLDGACVCRRADAGIVGKAA